MFSGTILRVTHKADGTVTIPFNNLKIWFVVVKYVDIESVYAISMSTPSGVKTVTKKLIVGSDNLTTTVSGTNVVFSVSNSNRTIFVICNA